MASVFGESGEESKKEQAGPTSQLEQALNQQQQGKVKSGIPGFDDSLGDSLPAGNIYLVSGSVGSNANQFVQQILYNLIISKSKVSYYTVETSSTDIIQDMKIYNMNIEKYVDEGTWRFCRVIPPNMKKIMEVLPEVPMEHRIFLDDSFTGLMNHYYETIQEGGHTAVHFPQLVRNFPLEEVNNFLFYMKAIARRYGGLHFILLTEEAHSKEIEITIKDTVDSVFEITTNVRGNEVENVVTITKMRGMLPKTRMVRLMQREHGLATETIRRVQ